MFVDPQFEEIEFVFRIVELLFTKELLLTEVGRKLFVEFMSEIGHAGVAGGERRWRDAHAGGHNAR